MNIIQRKTREQKSAMIIELKRGKFERKRKRKSEG